MNTDTYNVKDFGAKGDGTTDDQPAIQAAINAAAAGGGGVVTLPVGTYKINTSIYMNGLSNVSLEGTTNFGTIITPNFTSGVCIYLYNSYGYTIKKLRLEAPSGATGLVGIYCHVGAFMGFIDTFQIMGFNTAIQVDTNINDLTISNGIIESGLPDSFGIYISADSKAYTPPNKLAWEQRIDIIQIRGVTINQGLSVENNPVILNGTGIYAGQGLNTLRMDNVGLINNNYGFVATSSSTLDGPQFIFANDLEIDFSKAQSIYLDKGTQFSGCNLYLQGAQAGCIGINPGFSETAITTSRILPATNQCAVYNQSNSTTISTSFIYGPIEGPISVTQTGNIKM